jgi:hypothetical protein
VVRQRRQKPSQRRVSEYALQSKAVLLRRAD